MNLDASGTVILLIYGKMAHGGPFWCYVSIRPSQLEAYRAAEAAGKIDLYNFDAFGEVIVSAEGEHPPRQVTERVSELFGTDARSFFQQIDPLTIIQGKQELTGLVQTWPEQDGGWAQRVGHKRPI